ncbi:hypothetical protein POVWA2_053170 [Plasmodium ovale wallikeri]|uniref:Uncharacterized protein n=1 Tax=Plasmodium ovale wallikeri TaxID=864142 RepID=A0A1A8ZRG2_PLAOA|nr:hypothetical protein POVWA1_053940 [Plasmodium ovale wallikeri]SBT47047.1 hypothetical protein POVWA2_053170 [Plasmodium ovale wallikeri]
MSWIESGRISIWQFCNFANELYNDREIEIDACAPPFIAFVPIFRRCAEFQPRGDFSTFLKSKGETN